MLHNNLSFKSRAVLDGNLKVQDDEWYRATEIHADMYPIDHNSIYCLCSQVLLIALQFKVVLAPNISVLLQL